MDSGTYTVASKGLLELRRLDVVNNNLANVNTVGFKKQYLASETRPFEETLASRMQAEAPFAEGDHDRAPGVISTGTVTDFSPGSVTFTGNPLDVALRHSNDFFVVEGEGGEALYTRAGNFTFSREGTLVTQDGYTVRSDGGALTVSEPGAIIGPDGSVRVGDEVVGRLQVVRFDSPEGLERQAGARFSLRDGVAAPIAVEPELETQSLEMSNVSAITSVIDLISTNRAFSAYTKAAQTIDELNQSAINRLGSKR